MSKQLIKEAKRMQQLAGIINENFVGLTPINSPLHEDEEDDMEDTDEEEYDFNAPGKTDEFDTDDDIEPTAKDIKSVKGIQDPRIELASLIQTKDELIGMLKSGELTPAEYKIKIGDIPQRIKNIRQQLDAELDISGDEDEL